MGKKKVCGINDFYETFKTLMVLDSKMIKKKNLFGPSSKGY